MKPKNKKPKPPEILQAEELIAAYESGKIIVRTATLREARRRVKEFKKTGKVTPSPLLMMSPARLIPGQLMRVYDDKPQPVVPPSKRGGPHVR
jgi:hypothetical protein